MRQEIISKYTTLGKILRWLGKLNEVEVSSLLRKQSSYAGFTLHDQLNSIANYALDRVPPLMVGQLLTISMWLTIPSTFSEAYKARNVPLQHNFLTFIQQNAYALNNMIVWERDLTFDVSAICTMKKSHLARASSKWNYATVETPQYMYLRSASYMHYPDLDKIKETYDSLSLKKISHASPTLYNAGYRASQLSSCFVMSVGDSLTSIRHSWSNVAVISKISGGIGVDLSRLRQSEVGAFGGQSGSVVKWIKIYNDILAVVDQGTKRKGAGAMYLPDWHIGIFEFLDLRNPHGSEETTARDIFTGVMISDALMRAAEKDDEWWLFCPNKAKGLCDVWGMEFESKYYGYINQAKNPNATKTIGGKRIRARDLITKIIDSRRVSGLPYILLKDNINRKNPQSSPIFLSNLCTEVILRTAADKLISSCILAAINLAIFARQRKRLSSGGMLDFYDWEQLDKYTRMLVRNLNAIIDRNYYPNEIPEIKTTVMLDRPLGIGVLGFADALMILDIPFVDEDARILNRHIFERMYYAAVDESANIAAETQPHPSFKETPAARGILQFDMWKDEAWKRYLTKNMVGDNIDVVETRRLFEEKYPKLVLGEGVWDELREKVKKCGLANSTLIALMPTASSSIVAGVNECFEPFTSNMFKRSLLSGTFVMRNRHLEADLKEIELWDINAIEVLFKCGGSIATLQPPVDATPETLDRLKFLKRKYLTAFEMDQKVLTRLSADRGPFVCQSQSLNVYMKEPTFQKSLSMLYWNWKHGLKTSGYYLHTGAAVEPINYTKRSLTSFLHQNQRRPKRAVRCSGNSCTSCSV